MKNKKVLVSGSFDLLHAGHIAFLKECSSYGDLYVCIGTDNNIKLLKGRDSIVPQDERVYVVNSVQYVKEAFVSTGKGMLDFKPDIQRLKPDIFIVNEDGHTEWKRSVCEEYGVAYIVLKRIPDKEFTPTSSSSLKEKFNIPYRLCLAGGWMDQPWVSSIHPGSLVVVNLEPTTLFHNRSGMSTSTRKTAISVWGDEFPTTEYRKNAKILFSCDNPPGCDYVSGSQDSIGLVYPGINKLYYNGGYWPEDIMSPTHILDISSWLEKIINLVPLDPRPAGYDPLEIKNLNINDIKELGESGEKCFYAIVNKDIRALGEALTATSKCWRKILPGTIDDSIQTEIDKYSEYGACPSGSGGGYLMVVSDKEVENSIKIKIRY